MLDPVDLGGVDAFPLGISWMGGFSVDFTLRALRFREDVVDILV